MGGEENGEWVGDGYVRQIRHSCRQKMKSFLFRMKRKSVNFVDLQSPDLRVSWLREYVGNSWWWTPEFVEQFRIVKGSSSKFRILFNSVGSSLLDPSFDHWCPDRLFNSRTSQTKDLNSKSPQYYFTSYQKVTSKPNVKFRRTNIKVKDQMSNKNFNIPMNRFWYW